MSLRVSIVSVHCPLWLRVEPLQLLTFYFDAYPDPAFYCDTDPDPANKNNADPNSQPK
jgi:hypothetical protein